jgi:SAM-dependent methyltransferase
VAVEPSQTASSETDALRRRIDALEREHHERTERANAALAAAQDRAYWLERWNVDLNALMRRRGAGELRAAMRAVRGVYRFVYDGRTLLRTHFETVPRRVAEVRRDVSAERALAEDRQERSFRRSLGPDLLRSAPVTDLLFDRLSEQDLAAVKSRLDAAQEALWETADEVDRRRLALAFAAHHRLEPALERTGLSAEMPPAGVHAMAQGAQAAGGSAYYADLVADSLAQSGFELEPGMTGLDFGCSSGRVVRVLAAAFPQLEWHGCDPIPDAIDWARSHLPGIAFERSPERPPLPYSDGEFDFVFAISIWSHFSEGAALDWLREMHRIVRPGGRLLITTHGGQTIAHTRSEGVRSASQLEDVSDSLFEHGFWYAAEFGEAGDHGIANPDWGTAFLSSEWLLAKLTPEWRVAFFRAGRVEANQDLYVLERHH